MSNNDKIDFVIPWVDGSDPDWIKDYNKHVSDDKTIDIRSFRYRDWDNLQYWFRGIEKFTPWVNKIYFITWGHLPKWLNINHPKLVIVKHEDFLPKENLPVFNVNPLEINLHRIKGLSEKFVFFNDDTFIIKPTEKNRFFKNELPCNMAVETTFQSFGVAHIRLNVMHAINKHFSKRKQMKNNFSKWINPKYKIKQILTTLLLYPFPTFSAFHNAHKPNSFLISTFKEVWKKNKSTLELTSKSKFRSFSDVNQYLFEYWQLVKGDFEPISMKDVISINISTIDSISLENESTKKDNISLILKNVGIVKDIITKQKYRMLCINDGNTDNNIFEIAKKEIINAFNTILPKKSSFEI